MTDQRIRAQRVPSASSQARRHGLAPEEVRGMWQAQEERCGICRRPLELADAMIDHDHKLAVLHGHSVDAGCKRCVRGLLCRNCNTNLGWFEQRAERIVDWALRRRPRA